MDDLDRGLTRCKPVDYTDDDGTRWEMQPTSDTDVRAEGGQRQTTVSGVGTFSGGPADVDGSLAVVGTAVRVENNVVIVVMVDLTDDLGDAPHDVTQAASTGSPRSPPTRTRPRRPRCSRTTYPPVAASTPEGRPPGRTSAARG